MPRENIRRSVAGSVSVKSARSSISTLTQLSSSCSSGISAITMDESLGSGFERSGSYRNFGPTLRTMPEQQRASDPDIEEVQDYLDSLRLASSANSSSNNSHRFSIPKGDALCHIPRRKSSSSHLDYRTASQHSLNNSYFVKENSLNDSHSSVNPLHGDIDSVDWGLAEDDDEFMPLPSTPRSRYSQRSSRVGRGIDYYGVGISSISLDMKDIFGDEEEDEEQEQATIISQQEVEKKIFRDTRCPPADVCPPKMVKRRSSITYTSNADDSVRIIAENYLADSHHSLADCKIPPEDSGDICLAPEDDHRFETRCPKEKSNSILQPTRRVPAFTLEMRAVKQLTTCQAN